jgi:hypothetical protein
MAAPKHTAEPGAARANPGDLNSDDARRGKAKRASRRTKSSSIITDAAANAAFVSLFEQPAQLTEATAMAIESNIAPTAGRSQYRRTALALLGRSGKQLIDAVYADRDVAEMFADSICGIREAALHLRKLAELMETSATRIEVALCVRDDAVELLRSADREHAREAAP